jgi:hypothetical protein
MKQTNAVWQRKLEELLFDFQYKASPRGMKVKEIVNGTYKVPMPSCISLSDRKVNKAFMFAEAHWILSGSNRLEDVAKFTFLSESEIQDGIGTLYVPLTISFTFIPLGEALY